MPMDASGYPDVVVLPITHDSDALPVWDARETLLVGYPQQRPVLCSGLGELLAAEVAAHPFNAAAKRGYSDALRKSIRFELPAGRQRPVLPDKLKPSSLLTPLLAGNAVIFLTANWHVVAVGRTDAAVLWDIRLPAQPVCGGLSMTRAGDVLAPLVDGRVVCIGAPRDLPGIKTTTEVAPKKRILLSVAVTRASVTAASASTQDIEGTE